MKHFINVENQHPLVLNIIKHFTTIKDLLKINLPPTCHPHYGQMKQTHTTFINSIIGLFQCSCKLMDRLTSTTSSLTNLRIVHPDAKNEICSIFEDCATDLHDLNRIHN